MPRHTFTHEELNINLKASLGICIVQQAIQNMAPHTEITVL